MCLAHNRKSVDAWLLKEGSNTHINVHIRKTQEKMAILTPILQAWKVLPMRRVPHICCRRHSGVSAVIIRLSTIQVFGETLRAHFNFALTLQVSNPRGKLTTLATATEFFLLEGLCICVCSGWGRGIDLPVAKRDSKNNPQDHKHHSNKCHGNSTEKIETYTSQLC